MTIDLFTCFRKMQGLKFRFSPYLIFILEGLIFGGNFVLVSRGLIFGGLIFGILLYDPFGSTGVQKSINEFSKM